MFPGKFTRYVLWDVFKMFFLTLVIITMVISTIFVGQQLVAEGIGYLAIFKLLPFIFLIALQYSVPATLLFSVCSVYGRISADNEIVALKSAGVSPMRVFRPIWVLGFVLSFPSVWLNDQAVSWAQPGMKHVVLRSLEEILYRVLRSQRSYTSEKGFSIHVEDVQDRWLIKPTIWMFSSSTGQLTTIHSERARISVNSDRDLLIIELVDSFVDINRETQMQLPKSHEIWLPLDQASKSGNSSTSPSNIAMDDIPRELAERSEFIERRKEMLAARYSTVLGTGRLTSLNDPATGLLKYEVHETEKRVARLRTEPMRRWAMGFSCLAFVWMGVPMAILIRSADYWWSFGLCFVPILLVYYPLFGLALELSKDGTWPAFSLWLGNVTLAGIGTWLMLKVVRA